MNIEEFKTNMNQYFNYIRTVYLREYGIFLSDDKLNEIRNLNNIFKIDTDAKFKIYNSEKITICLDIENYIIENSLTSDKDLKDISIKGKIYVKYLIDNKDNLNKLISNMILRPIITYFVGKDDNPLTCGVIDKITAEIEEKYKIKYMRPYESKEEVIIDRLIKIIGEEVVLKSILNGNLSFLEKEYNKQVESEIDDNPFLTLQTEMNRIYDFYYKKIGKVFLSDSLYDYENLDYTNIINQLEKNLVVKDDKKNKQKLRIKSVKKSLDNLLSRRIIFDPNEQNLLSNSLIEVNSIIDKMDVENIEEFYKRVLEIEKKCLSLTEKLWKNTLTHSLNYNNGGTFKFLISNIPPKEIIEATLITDLHLKKTNKKFKYNYGFIYNVGYENIIYSTSKDCLTQIVSDGLETDSTIQFKNIKIDVDNQVDSSLLTPDLLMIENIKNKEYGGKVILHNPVPVGIFLIYNNELGADYEKAKELSEIHELPLVTINSSLYTVETKEEKKEEIIIENPRREITESKKIIPFSERLKKMFYEDEEKEEIVRKAL